jgi:tetratricopeptide (TPR) repeat protein
VPIDRDATLKSAEKLLRLGKLDAAITEYVRVITADPSDWSSINALGDLYVRAGQVERAVAQFARVGEHLVREGALAKAAAVYKKIVRISPTDQRGTRGLALVMEKQGASPARKGETAVAPDDPEGRMRAAREAQDASDVARACTLLIEAADLYQAQGRHADTLAAVAEASGIDPANAEYRQRLLRLLIAQGELAQARYVARVVPELLLVAEAFELAARHAEALETIAEAAQAEPENQALRERVLRQLIDSGELDRARRLARTPSDLLIVAEALNREHRSDEVLDLVAEAVEREPHNSLLREQLVTACLSAGNIDRAREAARTSREWMLLAQAMRQLGRNDEALAAMHEATQRDPHDSALHADFVSACIEAGDLAQARAEARTKGEFVAVADAFEARGEADAALHMRADALRRDPDDPALRVRLIRDYLRAGERDRAHALLTLDVAGDDPDLVLLLARLEFAIGRLDEGRRALTRLVTLGGDRGTDIAALENELADAGQVDAAFLCAELLADAASGVGDWDRAADPLRQLLSRVPHHVPALMKLIETCVDGGFRREMVTAQERLADAYLSTGRAAEARVIAEDLVLRAPWERANVDRCVRALMLCGEPDPERTIADLLSADSAFPFEDL